MSIRHLGCLYVYTTISMAHLQLQLPSMVHHPLFSIRWSGTIFHNTSFSSWPLNGSNKPERYIEISCKSLPGTNTLPYKAHLKVIKIMKCCEYGPLTLHTKKRMLVWACCAWPLQMNLRDHRMHMEGSWMKGLGAIFTTLHFLNDLRMALIS